MGQGGNKKGREFFYHGTSRKSWSKIKEEGVLWGIGNNYRYTYLTPYIEVAEAINKEVILEVEYDPVGVDGTKRDNYGFNPSDNQTCWQFSVFVPIPIDNVRRIN